MKNIVNGKVLRVGDRVRVINATDGALGVNDKVGTVIRSLPVGVRASGLGEWMDGILIKLDEPTGFRHNQYWRVGVLGEYELITPKKTTVKKHFDLDVIIKGNETKVVIGNKAGVSRCNVEEDNFNEAYGIILAIARAYKLGNDKVNSLVDVLYDDIKTLEDYDTLEIIDELRSRVED